jgi:hypothetical protein
MYATTSLILIASLASGLQLPPTGRAPAASGPIASAAAREAKRVALIQAAGPSGDWSRVRTLPPASELTVSLKNASGLKGRFVVADPSNVVILDVDHPALPERGKSLLVQFASMYPLYFGPGRRAFVYKELRVGADGVFVADQRVADRDAIVRVIPRSEIAQVAVPMKMRGSTLGAVGGAAAGLGLGFVAMLSTIDCPFAGNCAGWRARQWAPVWLPVASGLAGYHLLRTPVGGVIYRAP